VETGGVSVKFQVDGSEKRKIFLFDGNERRGEAASWRRNWHSGVKGSRHCLGKNAVSGRSRNGLLCWICFHIFLEEKILFSSISCASVKNAGRNNKKKKPHLWHLLHVASTFFRGFAVDLKEMSEGIMKCANFGN
jgi:hypothetical protein